MAATNVLEDRGWLTIERSVGGNPKASHHGVTNSFRFDFDRKEGGLSGIASETPSGVSRVKQGGIENETPRGVENETPRGITSDTQTQEEEHGNKNTGREYTGEAAPPPGAKTPPPDVLDPKKEDAMVTSVSEEITSEQDDAFVSFEEFWKCYPRKVKQKAARAAWDKALKDGHSPQEIVLGAMRFAQERDGEQIKFTPHPATWINDQRWLEATPTPSQTQNGKSSVRPTREMTTHEVVMMVARAQGMVE